MLSFPIILLSLEIEFLLQPNGKTLQVEVALNVKASVDSPTWWTLGFEFLILS